MGNNTSNSNSKGGDSAASGAYSPTPREENIYDQTFPPGPPTIPGSRYGVSSSGQAASSLFSGSPNISSPPIPPRGGLERRSHTMVSRDRRPDSTRAATMANRRLSTSDMAPTSPDSTTSDSLKNHLVENTPREDEVDVALGTTITVVFDRGVKTVSINKLFEVHCNSVDPSLNPVKGRFNYDARSQKAEFIPQNTLYPSSKYMVKLMGRAVTTSQCSNSNNIKNAELHFETCNPAPKEIGIKLKEGGVQPDILRIEEYYDLYNSLIIWSTRKWGCSGEHVTGLYTKNTDGKLLPLKADHDVLNLKENDIVLVEIKD